MTIIGSSLRHPFFLLKKKKMESMLLADPKAGSNRDMSRFRHCPGTPRGRWACISSDIPNKEKHEQTLWSSLLQLAQQADDITGEGSVNCCCHQSLVFAFFYPPPSIPTHSTSYFPFLLMQNHLQDLNFILTVIISSTWTIIKNGYRGKEACYSSWQVTSLRTMKNRRTTRQ